MKKIIAAALLVAACGSQNGNDHEVHEDIIPIKRLAAAIIFTKDGPTIVISNHKGVGGKVRGEGALRKIAPIAARKFSGGSGCFLAPFVADVEGKIYRSYSGGSIVELTSIFNERYSTSEEVESITGYRLKDRTKEEDVCK